MMDSLKQMIRLRIFRLTKAIVTLIAEWRLLIAKTGSIKLGKELQKSTLPTKEEEQVVVA